MEAAQKKRGAVAPSNSDFINTANHLQVSDHLKVPGVFGHKRQSISDAVAAISASGMARPWLRVKVDPHTAGVQLNSRGHRPRIASP